MVQNSAPLHSSTEVTEWILGSSLRFASLGPWMTKSERLRPIPNVRH